MANNKWDKQHLINLGLTQRQIDSIFDTAAKEAAAIGVSLDNFNPNNPFSFTNHPETKARIEKLIKSLQNKLETVVVNGTRSSWTLANNKNNALCDRVFGVNKYKLTKAQERKYYNNNDKALEAFIKRKTAGLNISDRVWNYSDQFKTEIEMGLDLGIRNGLSAVEMARDLKKYLKEPEKLFRRVRDEHGKLQLSKSAKAYNPGRGAYRSSYKNAMRLARTENNMAYRTSDHERWQQLDFVVGIEIRLSNNHTLNGEPFTDICDVLQGKYPKDFKFTGWHPQCRCHAISILKTQEEMMKDNERIMNGDEPSIESKNTIKDVPEKFKKWVVDNKDRIEAAEKRGTLPYFLKDNKSLTCNILEISDSIKSKWKNEFQKIGVSDFIMKAGDENYAKWINEGISELTDLRYDIPEIIGISKEAFKDTNALAYFDHATNALVFNGNYSSEELIELAKIQYDIGYFSTNNKYHIVRHEIGHWLHSNKSNEIFQKLQNSNLSFNFVEKEVSRRATEDVFEFCAEVFAGLINGRKYSKVVMNLYKELGGI